MRSRIAAALLATLFALAFAGPASASPVGFQTEDHKVGCYLSGDGVRCDVRNPKWEGPGPPACEPDWSHGVSVAKRRPAGNVCSSESILDPGYDVLAKGEKVRRGRFSCGAADASTVECMNRRNGHGFAVSRLTADLF